jgi:hypothetical protein
MRHLHLHPYISILTALSSKSESQMSIDGEGEKGWCYLLELVWEFAKI